MSSPSTSRLLRRAWIALLLGLLLVLVARWWLWPQVESRSEVAAEPTAAERQALSQFEQQRVADSLRRATERQAQWKARQREKAQRQAAYDSQRAAWAADKAERAAQRAQWQAHYDSLKQLQPEKFKRGTLIDLNEADSATLVRIPGIGGRYAQAILSYRERLGGFVSPSQVTDLGYLPHGIEHWFRLPPTPQVRLLRINRASFKELLRHPYLNYEQVKSICNRRQRTGALRDWDELRSDPHFSEHDFRRLAPYGHFE